MYKSIYKHKGSFKGILFVAGLLIIAVILIYTQHLVNILQEKSRQDLNFRVKIFEQNINNPNTQVELGFFFSEVIQGADYPIIHTDPDMTPIGWRNISPEIDAKNELTDDVRVVLDQYLHEMDAENPPIPIRFGTQLLGYYHYGVSPTIRKLRWLPYIEIGAAALFILIGYVGFSQIKKSEERHIWVGMAKETAHQLGTPLSSILGWIELLKENPQNLNKALPEIDLDSRRLSKVASRFSQIGSTPNLKKVELNTIITNTILYFNNRLPQLGKKVELSSQFIVKPMVLMNVDLFEWVLENLIKNSIDAIDQKSGKIRIVVERNPDNNNINIDVIDNGKGINILDKNNIFKPGFSSKKRGWGLGLSLAKRIIEDYHGGKLMLKESRLGEGSTFRIILKHA